MISEQDIKSYLAGEAPSTISARIEAEAEANPEFAARVAGSDPFSEPVRAAFAPVLGTAPDAPKMPLRRAAWGQWAIVAATVALAFGLGSGLAERKPPPDWKMEVAHYQALYVPDTLAHISVDSAQLTIEFARASSKLGMALDPEALARIPGLSLRRAQVLGYQGAPLIQVAYIDASGRPIAFCITKIDDAQEGGAQAADITQDTLVGLAVASWQGEGYGFLVIGGQDVDEITVFARQIKAALTAG